VVIEAHHSSEQFSSIEQSANVEQLAAVSHLIRASSNCCSINYRIDVQNSLSIPQRHDDDERELNQYMKY
jgi:hypothetical protein